MNSKQAEHILAEAERRAKFFMTTVQISLVLQEDYPIQAWSETKLDYICRPITDFPSCLDRNIEKLALLINTLTWLSGR